MAKQFPVESKVLEVCHEIRAHTSLVPSVCIILGSGLGAIGDEIEAEVVLPYAELPHFPKVSATGHAGNVILGKLCSLPVMAMQGRAHRYEGNSNVHVAFPIECAAALGAKTLIITNAAGGLNPRYQAGDLMVIDQHIHGLFGRNEENADPTLASLPETATKQLPWGCVRRGCEVYTFALIERMHRMAIEQGMALHCGTYLSTLGPNYETRAEYRMFRRMGADAVGMSTTTEALTAHRLGMSVLALSHISNVASTDRPEITTHAQVIDAGKRTEPALRALFKSFLTGFKP